MEPVSASALIAEFVSFASRLAVILVFLIAVLWSVGKGVDWLGPPRGDAAPEFEVGTVQDNALYSRVLQAEFTQIKADLASGAETVGRLLQSWTAEFEETKTRQSQSLTRQTPVWLDTPSASAAVSSDRTKVVASKVTPVDLSLVGEAVEKLTLLSSDIDPAKKVPEITVANVQWGPVLRWVIELFRSPAENKVVLFDDKAAVLIEGPIVPDGRTIVELGAAQDGKRPVRNIVQPVAYQILASRLAANSPKIDFGSWTALRDFVIGTRTIARLVSQPQPSAAERSEWNKKMTEAARLIEGAGSSSRDWKFISLASFLFERGLSYDDAIRVLEQHADLAKSDDDEGRKARVVYLLNKQVEAAVQAAIDLGQGNGKVFEATVDALAKLPAVAAARKLHRLDGVVRQRVKVAILSGAKPRWFGIDGPPDLIPTEDFLDTYGAALAQIVRELSPSADIEFVPVTSAVSKGVVRTSDILDGLDTAKTRDAPVILVPFGPLQGQILKGVLDDLLKQGRLVIVPAGNSGATVEPVTNALLAEGVDQKGERADYSSKATGSLGAIGELPMVDLTDAGPTVSVGKGTAYAAAALAAIAAESIARQPALRGIALREALLKAAAQPAAADQPPIARVVIPR